MTDRDRPPQLHQLPHHRLIAYRVAIELLLAIKAADIRDAKLRDEALRAAKSACCNIAEAAGRWSRADKARAFTIARGECVEAYAALEAAVAIGEADRVHLASCFAVTTRLYALLTGLVR